MTSIFIDNISWGDRMRRLLLVFSIVIFAVLIYLGVQQKISTYESNSTINGESSYYSIINLA